jgi:hypothetical protein
MHPKRLPPPVKNKSDRDKTGQNTIEYSTPIDKHKTGF